MLLEVSIGAVVLIVAGLALGGMSTGLSREAAMTRERSAATWAASDLIETLRNTPFEEVFARYNASTADDPAAGASPGHRFDVPSLAPPAGSPDGLNGEIFFPTTSIPSAADPAAEPALELREDATLGLLGGPRDLNGDSIIDTLDHGEDYVILPVVVRVEWTGTAGAAEYEISTVLCHFRKGDE